MLAPKRIRHRKVQRGSMKGKAKGYTQLHHGEYGIQALESSFGRVMAVFVKSYKASHWHRCHFKTKEEH